MNAAGKAFRGKAAIPFLLPTLVFMLVLQVMPMMQSIWLSLLRSRKETLLDYLAAPFIGLHNFSSILFDVHNQMRAGLLDAMRNTLIATIVITVATIAIGMIAALLVNRQFTGRAVARTLMIFPWIVPTYVVGLLWGFMWQQDVGLVNIILVDWLHIGTQKTVWLLGENTLWAVIIPTVWRQWPFAMIMLLAGLQTISQEIYEAAASDGAGPWRRFWHITWPMLRPVWSVLILYGLIFNVYSFNIVIMMFGNGAGYPGKYGDLVMTNLFRNSFLMWDFGSGAAMTLLLMAFMIVLVVVWYRVFKEDLST